MCEIFGACLGLPTNDSISFIYRLRFVTGEIFSITIIYEWFLILIGVYNPIVILTILSSVTTDDPIRKQKKFHLREQKQNSRVRHP